MGADLLSTDTREEAILFPDLFWGFQESSVNGMPDKIGWVDDRKALLRHFLAALAYRTQKALRGCSETFPSFRAAPQTRTPLELVRHMNSVLGYARTFFRGGAYRPDPLVDLESEVRRFHGTLADLARDIEGESGWKGITPERLLQGPLSDAMTHAGQIALLRRLAGDPIPPENFVFADISAANLTADQALPAAPDSEWPERPQGKGGA